MVAAERHRGRRRECAQKALEARAGSTAKSVDALVIVPDDKRRAVAGDQLHEPLLREVEVLILVDDHVWVACAIRIEHSRTLLEHLHRQGQQVLEVEQLFFTAGALVSAEDPPARVHQVRLLAIVGRLRPRLEALERNELLLEALQHLQRRRHQVIGSLVTGEGQVAELPHELARQDPAVGAGDDAEARGDADRPPIRAQPRQRDRMKRAHGRRGRTDELLDAVAHLGRRAICERHDQDGVGRRAALHQAPEAFGDDGGLTRSRPGHDPDRPACDGRHRALLRIEPEHSFHSTAVDRPMRTLSTRTRRPRSRPLRRSIMVSASSRS